MKRVTIKGVELKAVPMEDVSEGFVAWSPDTYVIVLSGEDLAKVAEKVEEVDEAPVSGWWRREPQAWKGGSMKFKVFKVTPDEKRSLEFQLEVGEVQPGTWPVDAAVDYVLKNVPNQDSCIGVSPLMDSYGVHLTKWAVLDDTNIYWFMPVTRFVKSPEPIEVKHG